MKRDWKNKILSSELSRSYKATPEQVWRMLVEDPSARETNAVHQISIEEYRDYNATGSDSVFAVVERISESRYTFELKNSILTGLYDCCIFPEADGKTEVRFRDEITFNSRLAWLIASYGMPLRRSQKIRADNLRKKLEQNVG